MNIMMFNGLLLFLLFMWTSAETEPETDQSVRLQVYINESRIDIMTRRKSCRNLGGKCVKKNKNCPTCKPLETQPGRPYCSKRRRCCYPGELETRGKCFQRDNAGNNCVANDGKPAACDYYERHNGNPGVKKCWVDVNGVFSFNDCGGRDQVCTLSKKSCKAEHGKEAKCAKRNLNYQWCYTGPCENAWYYCTGGCPNWRFKKNHVCITCNSVREAITFSQRRQHEDRNTVFANYDNNYSTLEQKLEYCYILRPVKTWECKKDGQGVWSCEDAVCCIAKSEIGDGHFDDRNGWLKCKPVPASDDCNDVQINWNNT